MLNHLPNEIIREIAKLLTDEYDYVHFIKTCKTIHNACATRINASWVLFREYHMVLYEYFGPRSRTEFLILISNPRYSDRFVDNNIDMFLIMVKPDCREDFRQKIKQARISPPLPAVRQGLSWPKFDSIEHARSRVNGPALDVVCAATDYLSEKCSIDYIMDHYKPGLANWSWGVILGRKDMTYKWFTELIATGRLKMEKYYVVTLLSNSNMK